MAKIVQKLFSVLALAFFGLLRFQSWSIEDIIVALAMLYVSEAEAQFY